MNEFHSVLQALFHDKPGSIINAAAGFLSKAEDESGTARKINASFLVLLMGNNHFLYEKARRFLNEMKADPLWHDTAAFYLSGEDAVKEEISQQCRSSPEFFASLSNLSDYLNTPVTDLKEEPSSTLSEMIHSVFFPEGTGIKASKEERIENLRERRTITITALNRNPIFNPINDVLFTSNVLLTVPSASTIYDDLPLSDDLKGALKEAAREPQVYWYDHPVQIGVEAEKNEILYGLKGLDRAVEFEKNRKDESGDTFDKKKLTVILSVSVTHKRLHSIAGQYIKEELIRSGGLKHIDVYLFTEEDTGRIVDHILLPFWKHHMKRDADDEFLSVFGVDGEYGRHYSFLKAIAAFWHVLISNDIKATFKIDLDQVFPQKELVEESGASAFEHLMTPLWGAQGTDHNGNQVELGLIAGALVNEKDIGDSLFTPDVKFPERDLSPDEYVFFNALPQALSTEAEMMTRYTSGSLDGKTTCIQRVHVTGGTNGILVSTLRSHGPFTPSFIGRAEDQAYIMSVLLDRDITPAYVHKDGLIMRHDKEAFAQEAIQEAHIGKLIGDYIRILYYSAYARVLTGSIATIKDKLDPFTGCFISKIPLTIVYLRFAIKAASFFDSGNSKEGFEFIKNGIPRISAAIRFTEGRPSPLKQRYEKERRQWNRYFDILSELEKAIGQGDALALELKIKAREIVRHCRY